MPCSSPGDLSAAQALVDSGAPVPADIVAVMGKAEGNSCVNEHTRDFAATTWCHFLSPHLGCTPAAVAQRVALVMSGGTGGELSPHFTVFTRRWVAAPGHADRRRVVKRLVVGVAHTRDFLPAEMGRSAQIEATATALLAAMADADISDPADVHFVQVKCPLLTAARAQAALARGAEPVTHDAYESMGFSRGACALGVAVALSEVASAAAIDAAVQSDWAVYSARASASAGIELENNVVIVLGQAAGAASPVRTGHTVTRDAVDAASLRQLLREHFDTDPDGAALPEQQVFLLAKAEASPNGRVRGERHIMCRALVHEPQLLLDEPFGALDHFTREELWSIPRTLRMKQRPTVLLVTHDLRESGFLANRIADMSARPGRILEEHAVPFARPRPIGCRSAAWPCSAVRTSALRPITQPLPGSWAC